VQNVLPSMEAAFIDIGKGRNAVLYAGEVNWSALGHKDGQPRKIESVLSSGQTVLVQVTKDPIGHKGARLTSQISLAGRFLVYVPDGTTSGISRKLPDTERNRLKTLLKEIVPEQAGVIVRTAAEGASEEELTRDVERLTARWDDIEKKAKGNAPQLLYGEPDLTLKVVRDLFTEDFTKLVIEGDDAWDTVQGYVAHVAPDLEDRLERYERKKDQDVFAAYRIDEQIKKGLDRKVWLPSGGSLIIDRTEAMTVVDVNTGKFTGSGGNLEETVTKNNLEAAEEIVRQLRLRDIGGIIVVDFIDMVLESNRDLVLRRLVECLGRDRTRHQVAEVTSLGLVQMTRKRIGTGLLESFSHDCPTCHGRGVVIEDAPVEPRKNDEEPRRARRSRGGRGRSAENESAPEPPKPPTPKDLAAMARHHDEAHDPELSEVDDAEMEALDTEQVADASPAVDEAEVETEVTSEVTDEVPAEATTEATTEPEPQPVAEPVAEPEKPRVVTRTRRRSASRPAGPPSAAADGAAGGSAEDAEHPVDESHPLHVPVKRKGARKR
jgi:ribonuclease E